MPAKVRKVGAKWETYNPETGKRYGLHDSPRKAYGQKAIIDREAKKEK